MLYLSYDVLFLNRISGYAELIPDSNDMSCLMSGSIEKSSHSSQQEKHKLMGISFFTSGLIILFLGLITLLILIRIC